MVNSLARGAPWFVVAALCVYALSGCSGPPDEIEAATSEVSNEAPQVAESTGIDFFHGTFEDALALAEEDSKKVFVDVYTTWCGPCIVMQETVFKEEEVGEYFNARFVNLKLDAENEDQNGPEIAARYDIGAYPTYLILDSSGVELSRATSAMSGEQFIALFSQMLGETESTFEDMKARYNAGERSQEFVQQFLMDAVVELSLRQRPRDDIEALRAHFEESDQYKKVALEYFESRPYAQLVNPEDAKLVFYYKDKTSRGDSLVEYVLENFDDFLVVSSDAEMSQFVLNATWYAALDAAQNGSEEYASYIEDLRSEPLSHAVDYEKARDPSSLLVPEHLTSRLELIYFQAINDWDSVFEAYKKRFEASPDVESASAYSSAARTLASSENAEHREYAVKWGRLAYDIEKNDPFVAANYIMALNADGQAEAAETIADNFRAGMSDSASDQEKLEIFARLVPIQGEYAAASGSEEE